MSKVKIVGNASGSGTLTFTGPDTNSDRTITLPDETGTVALGVGIDDNADATAITIDSSENVGIGVTDPNDYDSRAERLVVGEDGDTGITIAGGSSSDCRLVFAIIDQTDLSNGSITYDQSADSMAFETAGTERMRILSDGETLVGTNGTMSCKFGVTQTSATALATDVSASSASYTGTAAATSVSRNTTDTTYYFWKCQRRGFANSVLVDSGGTFTTANNSYGAISDQRLKTDIIDSGSQWDDIKAVKVRKYKMIQDPDSNVHLGVISQELEASGMNGLVQDKDADEYEIAAVDDASILKEGDKTKTVRYSVLYMKSIKALQEAMTRIETLEAKVTALENP